MGKYILKESELRALISEAVAEEVNALINEGVTGNVLRGLGNAALNTAKFGARFLVDPMGATSKALVGIGNVATGEKSVVDPVKSFFNGPFDGRGNATIRTRNNSRSTKVENFGNASLIKREFGEPETKGIMSKKLETPQKILITDFLGSGREVDFGKHYLEHNQSDRKSVWSRKLQRAQERLSGARNQNEAQKYIRLFAKQLKEWLKERDEAYKNYISLQK